MVVLSTIGTFVYVYFTYHVMKWAVGQGQAGIKLSELAIAETERRRNRIDFLARNFVTGSFSEFARRVNDLGAVAPDQVTGVMREIAEYLGQITATWTDIGAQDIDASLREQMAAVLSNLNAVKSGLDEFPFTDSVEAVEARRAWALEYLNSMVEMWLTAMKTQWNTWYNGKCLWIDVSRVLTKYSIR
jgi:hypothetical protein